MAPDLSDALVPERVFSFSLFFSTVTAPMTNLASWFGSQGALWGFSQERPPRNVPLASSRNIGRSTFGLPLQKETLPLAPKACSPN
jgi:hypothetical protein